MDSNSKQTDSAAEAIKAASLSLALAAEGEWPALEGMSSVHVRERSMLFGTSVEDSLSLFASGLSAWEMDHLRVSVGSFDPLLPLTHGVVFAVLDSETTLAAVPFSVMRPYLPLSPLKATVPTSASNASTSLITSYVVLMRATDAWLFHNLKVSTDWAVEARAWSSSVEEAKMRHKAERNRISSTPLPSNGDRDYWDSYDLSDVKNAGRPMSSLSIAQDPKEEETDDYWNSYENNLSRF
ncbi:hypothetical protein HDU80_005901 [Chytriomyces hyalinus]|nr:hypothetical protein HDU80_005901 [Chytriomyces hyalinus]